MIRRFFASYREGLEGVDRRAYVVVTITLIAIGSRMSLYTFLGIYFTREVGFTLALVGLAYLVENLARGLVAPIGGALSDRLGRKPVLVAAAISTALILPLFLLIQTPLQLFLWGIALGAAQAPSWPATSALLLDLSPPDKKQTVLSLNYTAISIGYTLGVAPAGFLLAFGFPVLAAVATAGFLLVALLALFAIRGPLPTTRAATRSSFLADVSRAWRDPPFVLLAALGCVFPLGIGVIATVAPLFAQLSGLDEGSIGLALATNGPLLAIFSIPVAAWIAPRGAYRYLAMAAALLAVSYTAFLLGGTFATLILATLVFTAGELIFSSAIPAAVAALAPAGLRGAYQGAWTLVFAVGSGSALFLSGVLEPRVGWRGTWIAWSVLTAIGALGLLLARASFRRMADARALSSNEAAAEGP